MPLLVAIPLAGGFLMPLVARLTGARRSAAALPILLAAGLLALAVWLLLAAREPIVYWVGGWTFPVGISLVADGLSRLMVVVVAVISLVALVFSVDYMARFTSPGLYYTLFLLMLAGMNGVVLSGDLFNIFVFLEVAGIASYALVAFGTESDELEAGFKYLVLGTIASTFILVGIALVYNVTGHLNWAKVGEAITAAGGPTLPIYVAAAFFLMGFGLKAAMVPFHAWLPDAHPSAPAPISAMLSGVLIKASGVYVLARLVFSVFDGDAGLGWVLVVLGTLSMVLGGLMAIGQGDFKRLLAYSSISQVGYVVLAFGAAAVMRARGMEQAAVGLAVFGGLFHLVNHAVSKSLLFLCSGSVEYATGTRQLDRLGGLGGRMPVTAACLRVGALSISGVPPLGGFWSKLIIIIALAYMAVRGHWAFYIPTALAVATAAVTLVYYAKVQRFVLDGEPSETVLRAREVPFGMRAATLVLAVLCFATALLVVPAIRDRVVTPATEIVLGGAEAGRGGRTITVERKPAPPPAQAAADAPAQTIRLQDGTRQGETP
ncbi:MAG: NADH/ubiquinone/plastoquinone (complex I) [Planctomycetes bacterium]|nr:NADH/ubiquinone/plastoquinone (complex I) [Planctomycetota bacterium]